MNQRLKPVLLAIEDDHDFRKGMEIVLERLGFRFVGVDRFEDFYECIEKFKPDLYLVDLQLGAQSGFDVIHELRHRRGLKEPILVVSGVRGTEAVAHAIELGASDFLLKPLDRTFLSAKLSRFIETDLILEHKPKFHELPRGSAGGKVEFDVKISEIDELGIRFRTSSLVPKGTVMKLRSAVLAEAGMPDGEALVAVVSSDLDPTAKVYTTYAEFDGVDVEILQRVRSWLAT
ncbi:MAG: response regulator [Bdellovibrionales bacterium]|nr:response regulator [Bdellovibrionales bacterium]